MERRVVITGLGAITPIGKDVNESWNSILNKKCGIDNISLFDNSINLSLLSSDTTTAILS